MNRDRLLRVKRDLELLGVPVEIEGDRLRLDLGDTSALEAVCKAIAEEIRREKFLGRIDRVPRDSGLCCGASTRGAPENGEIWTCKRGARLYVDGGWYCTQHAGEAVHGLDMQDWKRRKLTKEEAARSAALLLEVRSWP